MIYTEYLAISAIFMGGIYVGIKIKNLIGTVKTARKN
jgi:hypothetical protein